MNGTRTMSNDEKKLPGARPGERLLLENLRAIHRRAEAETILDILNSHPILSADEARTLVRRRMEALVKTEDSMTAPLEPTEAEVLQ